MAAMVSERIRNAVLDVFPRLKLSHRTLLRHIARNTEAGFSGELGELRNWGLVRIFTRRHVELTDVGEATVEYLNAYEAAASDHPKMGGLLGGTARLLVAQAAGEAALAKPCAGPALRDRALTTKQREYLAMVQDASSFANWAGCSYSTLASLVKKGLVNRAPHHSVGYSQWDSYSLTDAGRQVLQSGSARS